MTRYRVVNLAWQLGGDIKLLRAVASSADVLGLVECRDFHNNPVDVATALGPEWDVWQDLSDGARAGTAIAIRKGCGVTVRHGAQAFEQFVRVADGNSEVQARYMRTLKMRDGHKRVTLFVVHIPLASSGQQEAAMQAASRAWRRTPGRKIMMADGNMPPIVFAADLGAPHYSGAKPMVIAWSKPLERDGVRANWVATTGSDHKVGTLRVPA